MAIKVTCKTPLYLDKKSIRGIEISNFFTVITAGHFLGVTLIIKLTERTLGQREDYF